MWIYGILHDICWKFVECNKRSLVRWLKIYNWFCCMYQLYCIMNQKTNLVTIKSAIFWDLIIVLLKASLLYINEYLTYNVENETSHCKDESEKISSLEVRLLFSDVHKVQSPSQASHASRPYDMHRILIGRTLFSRHVLIGC